MTTWTVRATVRRIIDGDTFMADLDLGWKVWHMDQGVRILGLDTPERSNPRFFEAKAVMEALLPVDSFAWVQSTRRDSFGRVLAVVTLLDGTDVASLMPSEWWA